MFAINFKHKITGKSIQRKLNFKVNDNTKYNANGDNNNYKGKSFIELSFSKDNEIMRNKYLETLNKLKENFNRDESKEMKRGVKFTVKNINSDNNSVTLQWNGEGNRLIIENIVDDSEPTEMNESFAGKYQALTIFIIIIVNLILDLMVNHHQVL